MTQKIALPDASSSSPARLIAVGASLLLLAGLSYGLSFAHLGAFALPVALAIGATKAAVVLFAFMELGKRSSSFQLALLISFLLLTTLVVFVVTDVALRGRPPVSWQPSIAERPVQEPQR